MKSIQERQQQQQARVTSITSTQERKQIEEAQLQAVESSKDYEEAKQWEAAYDWYKKGKPAYAAQMSPWYSKYLQIVKGDVRYEAGQIAKLKEAGYKTIRNERGEYVGIDTGTQSVAIPPSRLKIETPTQARIEAPRGQVLTPEQQFQQRVQQRVQQIQQQRQTQVPSITSPQNPFIRGASAVWEGYGEVKRGATELSQDIKGYIQEKIPAIKDIRTKYAWGFQPAEQKPVGKYTAPALFLYAAQPFVEVGYPIWTKIRKEYAKGMYPSQKEEFYSYTPLGKERVTDILATYLTFSFFSPLMTTATAAKTKQIQVQKKKLTAKELKKYLEDVADEIARRNRYGTPQERKEVLQDLIKAYESGDIVKIKAHEEVLKAAIGDEEARILIMDAKQQVGLIYEGAGSPLIDTIAKPVTKTITETAKPLMDLTGNVEELKYLPQIVTGFKGAESIYAGKGAYEQTEATSGNLFIKPQEGIKLKGFETLAFKPSTTTATTSTTKTISMLAPATLSILKTKQIQMQQPRQITGQIQPQLSMQSQVLKQSLQTKQLQQQMLRQVQQMKQPQKQKLQQRLKQPSGFLFPKLSGGGKLKDILSTTKGRELFTALMRRRGKWLELGQAPTLEEAVKIGKKGVLSTLGASFKITKEGIPITSLGGLDYRFAPSRREKGVFIQKRRFRLAAFGERREIQAAKKRSVFFK